MESPVSPPPASGPEQPADLHWPSHADHARPAADFLAAPTTAAAGAQSASIYQDLLYLPHSRLDETPSSLGGHLSATSPRIWHPHTSTSAAHLEQDARDDNQLTTADFAETFAETLAIQPAGMDSDPESQQSPTGSAQQQNPTASGSQAPQHPSFRR
jgi:hypothetical protein